MYQEKRTDMVMITQSEYKRLLRVDAMVDLVLHMMKTDNYLCGDTIADILTIDRNQTAIPPAQDDLTDALGYTE